MQTQLQGVRIGASSLMTQVQGVKMGTSFSLTQLQGVKWQFQACTLENFN